MEDEPPDFDQMSLAEMKAYYMEKSKHKWFPQPAGDQPTSNSTSEANNHAKKSDKKPSVPSSELRDTTNSKESTTTIQNATFPHSTAPIVEKRKRPSTQTTPAIPKRKFNEIPSAYVDDRRQSSRPAAPHANMARNQNLNESTFNNPKPNSELAGVASQNTLIEKPQLPDWLKGMRPNQVSSDRNMEDRLKKIKDYIKSCLADQGEPKKRDHWLNLIRDELHSYEHFHVDGIMLRNSRLLDEPGLPQLFLLRKDGFNFPFDVKADAQALHNKWCRGDFDPDIMRGLEVKKAARKSTSVSKSYQYRIKSDYFGAGDLVSGQWWPILLAALRDGAHGDAQAGISSRKEGATSVLVSNAHYDDKDMMDTILYCGTEGSDGQESNDTKALMKNIRTGQPVRVLRSSSLPKENVLRPQLGFRYDGTYNVISYEVLNADKKFYRFKLVRESNQDPIRYKGIGARPTAQDIEAYQKHKNLTG